MNIMAHKTKEKTKENTKEKTKEIFLDCLVWKTLEFTKDITMDFGSRESLEIGNQGIDQAPRNIPWFLEAIPKEDVSWVYYRLSLSPFRIFRCFSASLLHHMHQAG